MYINFISVTLSFIFSISVFSSSLYAPKEIANFLIWPFSGVDYQAEYITELKEDNITQKQEIKSLKLQLNDKDNKLLQLKEKVINLQSTIAEFEEINKALSKREEELVKNEEKFKQSQGGLEARISEFEKYKDNFLKEIEIIKEKEGRAEQIIENNSQLRKRADRLENQLKETIEKYDQNLRSDKAEFNKILNQERGIFNTINSEARKSLNLSIYILLAFVVFILLAFAILLITWYLRSQNLARYPNRVSVEALETTGKQLKQSNDLEDG